MALALLIAIGVAMFVALNREDEASLAVPPMSLKGTRTIELLFPGFRGGVARESREIVSEDSLEGDVRTAIEALIAGSEQGARPVPAATIVRNVFWDGEGELTISFSEHLRSDHPGGSEAEFATLRSIVGTIGTSFPGVDAVRILIEGDVVSSLAGHADLSHPLRTADFR